MLSLDVIALPAEEDPRHWILYNVFTRTCLGVDSRAFAWLATPPSSEGDVLLIWNIGWFSNEEGTMADPTRFRRTVREWGEPKQVSYQAFIEACKKELLIIPDEATYRQRFTRKHSPVDGRHFGNFHDQIGAHLLMRMRAQPSSWWLKQKFTEDLSAIRSDNLYGQVQERFLRNYLPRRLNQGAEVLDLGCGIGFYSNFMAEQGCHVLGIDPNKDYIAIAKRQGLPGTHFEVRDIGKPGALDQLSDHSFDYVFIQDTLLFYFIPISHNDSPDLAILLSDLYRGLKPGGLLISIEPHPTYYLAPWLGNESTPFTIVTEHRQRRFSTVPTTAEFTNAILHGGFELKCIKDLYPDTSLSTRDCAFANEFPLWTLMEFAKPQA